MKLASVKDVKNKLLSDDLKKAKREDIIIIRNGRPQRSSSSLEEDLEDYIVEHDPKFRKIIEKQVEGRGGPGNLNKPLGGESATVDALTGR